MTNENNTNNSFQWQPQPQAAKLIQRVLDEFCSSMVATADFGRILLNQTGTRLIDWIDYFALPVDEDLVSELQNLNFQLTMEDEFQRWEHSAGMFPTFLLSENPQHVLAIKVESVSDFAAIHRIQGGELLEGQPGSALRKVRFDVEDQHELWAVERHGYRGWTSPDVTAQETQALLKHQEALRHRQRNFAREDHFKEYCEEHGFVHAKKLIQAAIADLGVDRTCDLFFSVERDYWLHRNRAARIQKSRQDRLGLGWANHDHHTFRSSRKCFHRLIENLELLGMNCREKFYAGKEAGWGAQVMEQSVCGILVFADVDLLPDEISGDFAHQPMVELETLGTVGLWCELHGDSFLEAGLHHLECQFDFQQARDQLKDESIESMPPFTNFDYLKQSFTQGEIWQVDPARIEALLKASKITPEQAEKFRTQGVIGSHLEILQRDDGFKGFNQTGISDIILRTDPRR